MNRLPFILERWKGAVSLAILVREKEIAFLADKLSRYITLSRVVFTIYVMKTITSQNTPYYVLRDGGHKEYYGGFYPVNTMRDLSIESITTTHCLVSDADMFPSDELESGIDEYAEVLSNYRNILTIPLFDYSDGPSQRPCYRAGECGALYSFARRAES